MTRMFILALLAAACTEPASAPTLDSASPLAVALRHRPANAELIDVRADGTALWGRRHPAPLRATVMPLFDAWLVAADGRDLGLPIELATLRDARFGPMPGPWLAVLDRDHVLWLWSIDDGELIEVSGSAFPGVSFSNHGQLVYASGPRPELELYVMDIQHGGSRQVTDLEVPLALPAFAEDGRAIVFASAFAGVPALWIIGSDGSALRQLTNRQLSARDFQSGEAALPMPEGRRAPLWHGSEVVFEAVGGVFAVDATGALAWSLADADLPHLSADNQLWVRSAAGARTVTRMTR